MTLARLFDCVLRRCFAGSTEQTFQRCKATRFNTDKQSFEGQARLLRPLPQLGAPPLLPLLQVSPGSNLIVIDRCSCCLKISLLSITYPHRADGSSDGSRLSTLGLWYISGHDDCTVGCSTTTSASVSCTGPWHQSVHDLLSG